MMKSKSVIPLMVLLAVLVGLIFLKDAKQERPNIQERVKTLIPADVSLANVAKLVISSGVQPDQPVTLVRDESDTEAWRVENHFNAPVNKDKISGYLDALIGAKGEFRATAASDEALQQYELTADKAFAVEAFGAGAEQATFKLLIGKAPSYQQVFVRMDGSNDVYVLDKDLRAEAGVYARGEETPAEAPKADVWLDKQVLSFDKTKATRLAFHTSYRDLTLEFAAKQKEAQPATDDEGEGAEGAPEQPEVTYEWVVAEGGPGAALKPNAVDGLLNFLSTLKATDIVDPATAAEWGLETPAFTSTITVDGQEFVLEGGCPESAADGYVRVKGKTDVFYKLPATSFEKAFGKGSDLFELAKLDAKREDMKRIEVKSPTGNYVLTKKDETWAVESPKAGKEANTAAIDGVVNAVASLKASDYADSSSDKGLEKPSQSITVTAGDKTHTVAFGNKAGCVGVYARFASDGPAVIVNPADISRIYIDPKGFVQSEAAPAE